MIATEEKLQNVLIKHNGHKTKAAKELGMTPHGVYKRLKDNPEIRTAVEKARDEALKKAKITRARVYGKIGKNLDSPVTEKQKHAIDRSLELLGDRRDEMDGAPDRPVVVMPVVVVNGQPMHFDVGG